MENKTPDVLGTKDDALVIPTDLVLHLKRNAQLIITSAQKNGVISTREIAAILKPGSVSDRNNLKTTLGLLDSFLAGIGLSLARGRVDFEKRSLPLPLMVSRVSLSLRFQPLSEDDYKLVSSISLNNTESEYYEFALYQEVIRKFPLLDYKQTLELFKKRADGDLEAHYRLVLHNLKLVFHLAYKNQGRGIDLSDLVQEGVIGLLRAIEKFEWQRGFHLSTYATWWIRNRIQRAIMDKARTIRLPAHFLEKYHLVQRMAGVLEKELGREPTSGEIGERLNLPAHFVSKMFEVSANSETSSIDAPLGDDSDSTQRHNTIADSSTVSPDNMMEAKETLEAKVLEVRAFLVQVATLPRLDDRWRDIFRMRYSLNGTFFARHTLEAVGVKFGLTRARIGQIVDLFWQRLGEAESKYSEDWLLAVMDQIEELESVTGILTKV